MSDLLFQIVSFTTTGSIFYLLFCLLMMLIKIDIPLSMQSFLLLINGFLFIIPLKEIFNILSGNQLPFSFCITFRTHYDHYLGLLFLLWALIGLMIYLQAQRKQRMEQNIMIISSELLMAGYLYDRLHELMDKERIKQNVLLYKSHVITGGVSFGGRFHRIIISDSIDNEEDVECILLHELHHIKQHHSLLKTLTLILCSINWFNPFVYCYKRSVFFCCELIADDGANSGKNISNKCHYVDLLVRMVQEKKKITINLFSDDYNFHWRTTRIISRKQTFIRRIFTDAAMVIFVITSIYLVSVINLRTVDIQNHFVGAELQLRSISNNDTAKTVAIPIGPVNKKNIRYINTMENNNVEQMLEPGGMVVTEYHRMNIDASVAVSIHSSSSNIEVSIEKLNGRIAGVTDQSKSVNNGFQLNRDETCRIIIKNVSKTQTSITGYIDWLDNTDQK